MHVHACSANRPVRCILALSAISTRVTTRTGSTRDESARAALQKNPQAFCAPSISDRLRLGWFANMFRGPQQGSSSSHDPPLDINSYGLIKPCPSVPCTYQTEALLPDHLAEILHADLPRLLPCYRQHATAGVTRVSQELPR